MFIQVIQARTDDPAGLRRQLDRWRDELAAGATGWLGSTVGVTADGEVIGFARFESEEAARANSDRPEQGQWWAETEKFLSGPATFHDTTEVDVYGRGGSDDAGFVQAMQGRITDLERARQIDAEAAKVLPEARPDLLGTTRARYGDGEFTDLAYFTSEAEARAGEAKELPEEFAGVFGEWQEVVQIERFLDLTDPWTYSP